MENTVLRQGEETRTFLTNLVLDISAGLYGAAIQGVGSNMPDYVEVSFTCLMEDETLTVTDSQVNPETTETQTAEQPAVQTVSVQDVGTQTNRTRPASQQTETVQTGGDRDEQTNTYGTASS